jgi:hypothetical protein
MKKNVSFVNSNILKAIVINTYNGRLLDGCEIGMTDGYNFDQSNSIYPIQPASILKCEA